MSKIDLDTISSGYQSTVNLNDNFQSIEDELNNKVLYRDNPEGEPNQMLNDLDMDSNRIINLPSAASNNEPATYGQLIAAASSITSISTLSEEQTASSDGQSVFNLTTVTYTPGAKNLVVYRNGVKIPRSSYTETDTSTITLSTTNATSVKSGDEFEFEVNQRDVDADTYLASNVTYTPAGSGAATTDVQTKLRESVSVKDFGAVGDGVTDDTAAIQAAIDYAVSSGIRRVILGPGVYAIGTQLTFATIGIYFGGAEPTAPQVGSTLSGCTIAWTGGASSMFASSSSYNRYENFSVENRGTATDWLELNSGSIGNVYRNLNFIDTTNHTAFSRSVIRSNGNRLGYSFFSKLQVTSPAPVFLDIDGQGTANGITPITFKDRCLISASTAMTFIKVDDESLEGLTISDCTFIGKGVELCILDTTTNPLTDTVYQFAFENNEIDATGTDNTAWRFFKLENVQNIAFNNNTINGGGTKAYIGDLDNCQVTSCDGNSYKSIATALFDADADTTIKAGHNAPFGSYNQRPLFTTATAGITELTYGASIIIDGRELDPGKHEILTIDVTNSSGYTISIDTSAPQFMTIGQVFTVIIKNVSGGAISAGIFNSATFNTSGATVAPADGNQRAYTFFFNGTDGQETNRSSGDVAN